MKRQDKIGLELLKKSTIMITGEITQELAHDVIQQLLYLETTSTKDIHVYINSPGGSVVAGLAILDALHQSDKTIKTLGMGMCASMGALLLSCGAKRGNRYMLPHCQVMFHEVSTQNGFNKISQLIKSHEHTIFLRDTCNNLIAEAIGMPKEELALLMEKDIWLHGDEVLNFGENGAVDHVK